MDTVVPHAMPRAVVLLPPRRTVKMLPTRPVGTSK